MGPITVRMMNAQDVNAVADIENRVLGNRRHDYWAMKMEADQARSPIPLLVAECDNHVVGFVMGSSSGWEHGVPGTVGWIDSMGIAPEYQRHGAASLLVKELISYMRKVGVTKVYTLVNWRDPDMLQFFDKLGFSQGDMLNLELEV